jgi:hypothetical protein
MIDGLGPLQESNIGENIGQRKQGRKIGFPHQTISLLIQRDIGLLEP